MLGLVGYAVSRMDILAPAGNEGPKPGQDIDPGELGVAKEQAEASDAAGITTVSEYKFKPSSACQKSRGPRRTPTLRTTRYVLR